MKRRRQKLEEYAEKRDPVKEANTKRMIEKKVNSKSFDDMLKETEKLTDSFTELLRPGALEQIKDEMKSQLSLSPSAEALASKKLVVDPVSLVYCLRRMKESDAIVDTDPFTASSDDLSLGDGQSSLSPTGGVDLATSTASTEIASLESEVTPEIANAGIVHSIEGGDWYTAKTIHDLMKANNIPLLPEGASKLMEEALKRDQFDNAHGYLEEVLASDRSPNIDMWSHEVILLTKQGRGSDAWNLINRLEKFGLSSPSLYLSLLRGHLARKELTKMEEVWAEMHFKEAEILSVPAFSCMIECAGYQGKVERALFLFDELKSIGLRPDESVFLSLLSAASRAPHWVKGYENTVNDVLTMMETHEMMPTTAIYNKVIYAFGKAGDPVAAEFYFWEMQQKGLSIDRETFVNLLDAYAYAQNVGASTYGWKGRYIPKPERMSLEKLAAKELGPLRMARYISEGLYTETQAAPGRRVKVDLKDTAEDDEDAEEEKSQKMLRHAVRLRRSKIRKAQEKKMKILARAAGRMAEFEEDDDEDGEDVDEDPLADMDDDFEAPQVDDDDEDLTEDEVRELLEDRSHLKQPQYIARFRDRNAQELANPFPTLPSRSSGLLSMDHDELEEARELARVQASSLQLLEGGYPGGQTQKNEVDEYRHQLEKLIETDWKMVEFGKAPSPSYYYYRHIPLSLRRKAHKRRAELLYKHFLTLGYEPDEKVLTSYLAVSADAGHVEDALKIYAMFGQRQLIPRPITYEHLVRMFLRVNDLPQALGVMQKASASEIVPTAETYGMVLRSLTQRGMLVEALKVLEEATTKKVVISERNICYLRSRCRELGIHHPAMPSDPNEWIREMKQIRKERKNAPRRKIQELESVKWA
eukprot:scaffold1307_cov166-Ochromonas_danica.AAC.35